MKRLLIINGSPHRNGHIAMMLKAVANEAIGMGAEVDYVDVTDLRFTPCAGCMRCRTEGSCLPYGDDDAGLMAERFRRADCIVIGTPTYWANMSGQLKLLLDRLVYCIIDTEKGMIPQPLLKGKRYGVVISSNASRLADMVSSQATGAEKAVDNVVRMSGMKKAGSVKLYSARYCSSLSSGIMKQLARLTYKVLH